MAARRPAAIRTDPHVAATVTTRAPHHDGMAYTAPPGLESRIAALVQPQVRNIARDLADNMARTAPPGAVWQTAADERVRPSHRESEGQTIPGNLRFQLPKMQYVRGTGQYVTTSGYDLARAPRDEELPPEQKINCRCQRIELPHDVANHIRAHDPRVEGARCIAEVTVTYPRIAESEHPDTGDGGGGWIRDAVQRTASARRLR
jgi:hypothetical protein